jgi:hypothetical protein
MILPERNSLLAALIKSSTAAAKIFSQFTAQEAAAGCK